MFSNVQLQPITAQFKSINPLDSDKTIHKSFVFWAKVSLCNQYKYKKRKYLFQSLEYCNSEYAFFSHYQMSNNGYQKSNPQ